MAEHGAESGFERHRREQRRAWLRLSYRERLEWLEQAKRFAARALEAARARRASRASKNLEGLRPPTRSRGTVEFVVGDQWRDTGTRVVHRERDHSFDLEGERPKGVASLLVNDLQLEIDQAGCVLYPWGLCPRSTWEHTEALPPACSRGTLIAQVGEEIVPGVSRRIGRWPVYQNQSAGWVCVGDPDAKGDRGKGIEFAPGCLAVLEDRTLVALWMRLFLV